MSLGRPLDSIDALLKADADYGIHPVGLNLRHTPAGTAANATSGKQPMLCWDRDYVVPSVHADLQGWCVGAFAGSTPAFQQLILVKKVLLGYLTFTGGAGTYTNVAAMPSRYHYGAAAPSQVIPDFPLIRSATTPSGSTTPTITVDYTDADNGAGRSTSQVFPSNPLRGSGFLLGPNMQGDDRKLVSVQSMATSGGSTGVLEIWGCRMLGYEATYSSNGAGHTQVFQTAAQNQPILEPGDLLNVLKLNTVASAGAFCQFDLVPVTKP